MSEPTRASSPLSSSAAPLEMPGTHPTGLAEVDPAPAPAPAPALASSPHLDSRSVSTESPLLPHPVAIPRDDGAGRDSPPPPASGTTSPVHSGSNYELIEIDNKRNVVLYRGDDAVESPNDLLLPPEPMDARLGARQNGLSSEEASRKLLETAHTVLAETTARCNAHAPSWSNFLVRSDLIITLIHIAVLIASLAIPLEPFSPPSNDSSFLTTASRAVELALFIGLVAWNAFLYATQVDAPHRRVLRCARDVIRQLERAGLNTVQEIRIPSVPSVPIHKVVRDGVIRSLPSVLLVKGDIVELHYGDIAPARCRYVYVTKPPATRTAGTAPSTPPTGSLSQLASASPGSDPLSSSTSSGKATTAGMPNRRPEYVLESGSGFRPTLFGVPPTSLIRLESQLNHGRFQFELLETPLVPVLQTLVTHRPNTVMTNQLLRLQRVLAKVLIVVYALSIIIAVVRHFIVGHVPIVTALVWAYSVVLPVMPMIIPTLYLLFRTYSNAHLIVLWDELQSSKTDYEDDDVDEFDVDAPPPTKEITLAKFDILSRALDIDTSDLTESLGTISVLCFVDREGTLTQAFPTVDQLFFAPQDKPVLDVAAVSTDNTTDGTKVGLRPHLASPTSMRHSGDALINMSGGGGGGPGLVFEDRDWASYLPLLKPLGLVWMCLTHCDLRKNEPHRNLGALHVHAHTKASRQTCLCPLARLIGFTGPPDGLVPYKEIFTFAPYHPSLDPDDQWSSSSAASAVAASSVSAVTAAQPAIAASLPPQVVAEGAGAVFRHPYCEMPAATATVRTIPDYEFEVPFVHALVLHDRTAGDDAPRYQLVSAGSVEAILDLSTDCWFGDALVPMTPQLEESIYEWYLNATANDHQVVAYAYRPILAAIDFMPADDALVYLELPFQIDSKRRDLGSLAAAVAAAEAAGAGKATDPSSSTGTFAHAPQRTRRRSHARVVNQVHGLLHQQIFLGLASFAHEPKEDVCDVIEDIGLAGIRFVYFSPTNERQTKAFGERLGLDTDWNACILLSSPGDPNSSPGYVAMTDIKAQLPRGVDAIRDHLEHVDDIPLHVSLFAESRPESAAEMIRIFQAHGEVVCCLGSALNHANTHVFQAADLAIAMQPLPIKQPITGTRAADSHHAHMPPLALGSSLAALPCALAIHSDTSLYTVTQAAREARRLCRAARQAFALVVSAGAALSVAQFVWLCMVVPPWRAWVAACAVWAAVPLVAAAMVPGCAHEPDAMKQFTDRNVDHVRDLPRFVKYAVARWCLPVVALVWLYWVALQTSTGQTHVFGVAPDLTAEWVAATALVIFAAVASATYAHRTVPVWSYNPLANRWWCVTVVVVVAVQVGVLLGIAGPALLADLPWHFWVVLFGSLPVQVGVHEWVKHRDHRQWLRFQKRSKLEFNTRLGMHSPV
ncbi:hypothetical protein GGF32_000241 [Allomyces javanicus]|nr:hypothetical protein GGF32_000241 [Allomyces javanicus]